MVFSLTYSLEQHVRRIHLDRQITCTLKGDMSRYFSVFLKKLKGAFAQTEFRK